MFSVKEGMETDELINVVKSLSDDHYYGYDSVGNRNGQSRRDPVWANERIDRQELIEAVKVLSQKVETLETAMRIATQQLSHKAEESHRHPPPVDLMRF